MNIFKKLFEFTPESETGEFLLRQAPVISEYDVRDEEKEPKKEYVRKDIEENLAYLRKRFSYPLNNDIVIRPMRLKENRKAFIMFIDGMVDTASVNNSVIETLLKLPYYSDGEVYKYEEIITEKYIAHSQAQASNDFDEICEEINFGSCAVFVDGMEKGFILDVRSWGHRSIDKPENEQSIYGPQEAFSEMLRNNTALIRKIIKTEKLVGESIKIGNVSKTRGILLYISDIANQNLVNEVRYRLNSISVDYIVAVEEVEQLIDDKPLMLTTRQLLTERPDRAARALTEGRCVFLLNGSPRAIILPTNAFELTHAVSDDYLRAPYANMSRIIRLIAMFLSTLLPALYLAITLFHQEIIPTYLLYSIAASRENVPFPTIVELILMDFSFEMIREAGIRMPGPISSTLGIVGGLILGQAAVSAKIVSPIMIIIIAITGIGSFATADYSLEWTYRILRLGFIVLAAIFGLYGVAAGIVIYALYLGTQRSMGVNFLSPLPKTGSESMSSSIFMNAMYKREMRPSFLKPKKTYEEPKISRGWKKK
ncbi:MAG: spore germination protein [Firmicutes bacterium]|nr:spore germination protein [Bacillota bacterium]